MMQPAILISAICAVLSSTACAASESTNCPDIVDVRQQLTTSVDGWKPILDDTPHRLAGITFYDGPPEEKASLVNDQTTQAAGKETATWHFSSRADRPIWIACGYAGTAVVLTRMLPPNTNTCSVTYNPRQRIAGLPMIEKIVCK
jgi:hypothetical protein